MSMSRKITLNVTAASVSMLSGLLRNKIFAAFLSINLFGILSIGQQSTSLLFTFFAFGLPLGITTFSAQLLSQQENERRLNITRVIVLSFALASICGVLLALIVAIDPIFLSQAVTGKEEYVVPISILLFSVPLMIVESCLFAIMEGMGRLKDIVAFKIIPSLIVLPMLYLLVARNSLTGAAVGLVVNEIVLTLLGLYLLRGLLEVRREALHVAGVFRSVFKVAVLSFLVGFGWFVADFLVKRFMLHTFGEVSNGIIQSVAKITDIYPTIALSWLTMHLFPVMASNAQEKDKAGAALERTLLVAVAMIVPIIIGLFALRPFVLDLLYKRDFVVAVGYFGAMLATGVIRVYAWVLSAALLPLGLRREWFSVSFWLIILYFLSVFIGTASGFGIYAVPFGLGIGFAGQAVYTWSRLRIHRIVFSSSFTVCTSLVIIMTATILGALFWLPLLLATLLVYVFLVHRYDLFAEFKSKILTYFSDATP
jgi:O-antigen/teichoic acid export membrane protein